MSIPWWVFTTGPYPGPNTWLMLLVPFPAAAAVCYILVFHPGELSVSDCKLGTLCALNGRAACVDVQA